MRTVIIFLIAFIAVPCAAQWTNTNFGGNVFAFGVHDTSLFVSGVSNDGSTPYIYRLVSTGQWELSDYGIDWTQQGNINSFASLGVYFFAGDSVGTAYRSTDNGFHWAVNAGGPVYSNGTYLFGSSSTTVYRSTDSGGSWTPVPGPGAKSFGSIGICIFDNTGTELWRSTDTGNHWSQLSPPFTGTITPMDSLLFIVSSNGAVAESLDLGSNWSTIAVDTAGEQEIVKTLATDSIHLFAGTNHGILISNDKGKTWMVHNEGIQVPNVTLLTVFDTFLFAQVQIGSEQFALYKRPISEIVDSAKSGVQSVSVPASDSISIYPNPATGTVSILAGGTSIFAVSVLNVLGEDVLDMPSLREADISLDLSKLPAGTYFFKIQTSSGTQLRKITIER